MIYYYSQSKLSSSSNFITSRVPSTQQKFVHFIRKFLQIAIWVYMSMITLDKFPDSRRLIKHKIQMARRGGRLQADHVSKYLGQTQKESPGPLQVIMSPTIWAKPSPSLPGPQMSGDRDTKHYYCKLAPDLSGNSL